MRVRVLVDDSSESGGPAGEHGLSLYIESNGDTILFDTGQSDMFVRNAETMGIDLSKVGSAVISHGHYDHGGGLRTFLRINEHAPVYIHRRAFEPHLSLRSDGDYADIGIDPELMTNKHIVLTNGNTELSGNTLLFSDIEDEYPVSRNNGNLFMRVKENILPDDFQHEQSLLICENDKTTLVVGCAHRGVENIVAKAKEILGKYPNAVIGGLHLCKLSENEEGVSEIDCIAKKLSKTESLYFTCHCTGTTAYEHMKAALGDRINILTTGTVLEL